MADKSRIRWTGSTWNPMSGCDKLSPGCDNCYAYELAERMRGTVAYPVGFDTVFKPHKLGDPGRWKEPTRVFVNSMSDWAHEDFTNEEIAQVFDVMVKVDRHQYQLLTKRPTRAVAFIRWYLAERNLVQLPDHIWIGVTIENDRFTWRANLLREIRDLVGVLFISAEPLLSGLPSLNLDGIDWLICGGESGNRFRGWNLDWARDLRDRCHAEGVSFFFKQSAARYTETGVELDGERIEEYPRQSPEDDAARRRQAERPELFR